MEDFKIIDMKIVLPRGEVVDLSYPVAELISFKEFSVVRFDVPIDEVYNENVVAIDSDGCLMWKIASRKYVYENSPYMKIIREGENVVAHNWDGQVLVLHSKTGRIVEKRQTK